MKGPDCHNTDAGLSDQVEYPRGWLINVAGGSGDITKFCRLETSIPGFLSSSSSRLLKSSKRLVGSQSSLRVPVTSQSAHTLWERGSELSKVFLELAV